MMKMQLRTLLFCTIIVICSILAFSLGGHSEIYKWVDENGVIHFSDTLPPNKNAKKLQERSGVLTRGRWF